MQYAYSPQALNRYSYVLNNPLTYSDPTGHRACEGPMGECWYTDPDPNIGTMPVRGWEPDPAGSSASGGGVTASQQEGVPGIPLEDWEVDLLAATIMAETRMGRWDNNTQRLIAWVMLNRLSLGTHRSLWLAVKGVQSAVSCLYESDSERCRGSTLVVPFGGDPEAWTFAVTDALSSGNYPSYPLTRQLAGEVYQEWLEYGTYSAHDPTGGMVDFSIVSPEDRSSGDPNIGGNERTQAWRASRWPGYRYQYLPEDGPLYLEGIEGGRYILIYNRLLTIPPDAR